MNCPKLLLAIVAAMLPLGCMMAVGSGGDGGSQAYLEILAVCASGCEASPLQPAFTPFQTRYSVDVAIETHDYCVHATVAPGSESDRVFWRMGDAVETEALAPWPAAVEVGQDAEASWSGALIIRVVSPDGMPAERRYTVNIQTGPPGTIGK